jgi:hypothetical protein
VRRFRLLIDVDAARPAGISSTEEELQAALDGTRAIRDYLDGRDWPAPLFGCSGNGAHLVYGIDLPNDQDSTLLLSSFLQSLSDRFTSDGLTVDTTVFSAARISKLYGTKVMKGDHTADRPHRYAKIIEAPDQLEVVPIEAVRGVVRERSAAQTVTSAPAKGRPRHLPHCPARAG